MKNVVLAPMCTTGHSLSIRHLSASFERLNQIPKPTASSFQQGPSDLHVIIEEFKRWPESFAKQTRASAA